MTNPRDGEPVAEKALSPAARRARAEAEVRRAAYRAADAAAPKEHGGRGGRGSRFGVGRPAAAEHARQAQAGAAL